MTDIKKLLDEARDRLAIEHNKALMYFENASFDQVYKNGFDANKEIIVELVEALDSIDSVEQIKSISDSDETEWWYNSGAIEEIKQETLAKVEARLRGIE